MKTTEAPELRQLAASIAQQAGVSRDCSPWEVVEEQGLDRIGICEEQGGLSGSIRDVCHLIAALTEHGWDGPAVEATVAQMAIARRDRHASERRTTIAFADGEALSIADHGATGTLTTASWVRDAAALVVVTPDRVIEIGLDHRGVHVEHSQSVHGTPLAAVRLDQVPFQTLGGDLWSTTTTYRFGLISSAALVGGLRAAYEMTRNFVLTREQFGRPLARINSVGVNLARMRTEILMAEVALQRAVELDDPEGFDTAGRAAVCAARVSAGTAATTVSHLAHRLHGAMGITMEYPLHRHTTRLWELRDAGLPEAWWASQLGAMTTGGSESDLWDTLTA